MGSRLTTAKLARAGLGSFFRPRDVAPLGVAFRDLQEFVREGSIEKVAAGIYRVTAAPLDELETVALVGAAVPQGIVCLLSALRIHEIGTQSPADLWVALDRKARKPVRLPARVRFVRFSGPMLTCGVTSKSMLGVPVRITSPARTVVDCFRYRNKLGLDVALEALRDVLRSRKVSVDAIMRMAAACRARSVLRTYLEALSSI